MWINVAIQQLRSWQRRCYFDINFCKVCATEGYKEKSVSYNPFNQRILKTGPSILALLSQCRYFKSQYFPDWRSNQPTIGSTESKADGRITELTEQFVIITALATFHFHAILSSTQIGLKMASTHVSNSTSRTAISFDWAYVGFDSVRD